MNFNLFLNIFREAFGGNLKFYTVKLEFFFMDPKIDFSFIILGICLALSNCQMMRIASI